MKRPVFGRITGPAACLFVALLAGGWLSAAGTAQAQTLSGVFAPAPGGTASLDHGAWDKLLRAYVRKGSDGVNRVAYGRFKADGHGPLKAYVAKLEAADVARLTADEQFAFWVNLYNAKTVDLVLDHYPVKSIQDIAISPGLLAKGPWGKKVVRVAGRDLSLDDIEHRILRPIWRDARIHYAVNCASIGCPDLPTRAFTGANKEQLLEAAARAFVNHPRGVAPVEGGLRLSRIYSWYAEDFGRGDDAVLAHIARYAKPELAARIKARPAIEAYQYDWRLNDAR